MSVKITYFAHGTTTDNEKGLSTGWAQDELSSLGITQAKKLGKLVANKIFDAVFSSDFKRALDTARLAFGDKYNITQDERLRESNYGDFTQKPAKTFKQNLAIYVKNPFPNGESYLDVEKRVKSFLTFLKKNYLGKNIAIVAHEAPQLALEVLLKNKTWEDAIKENWRDKKAWQPGWEYLIK